MNDNLNIKVNFMLDGEPRVDTLRLHVNPEGNVNFTVENGKTRGGERKYGRIRLDKIKQKKLIEFLQRNIK